MFSAISSLLGGGKKSQPDFLQSSANTSAGAIYFGDKSDGISNKTLICGVVAAALVAVIFLKK